MIRNDFCVYLHLRPDGSVFYVGKGVPSRPYRKDGRNMTWKAEVAKIGTFSVQVAFAGLTEEQAFAKEVELISELRESGVVLVNQTRGGDGCKSLVFTAEIIAKLKKSRAKQTPPTLGYRHTEDARKKLSAQHVGENNPMFGKKHTDETREKFKDRPVARAWAGKKLNTEHKQKMSESHKARPQLTCPHCNKIGGSGGMLVHHFNNCKMIGVPA